MKKALTILVAIIFVSTFAFLSTPRSALALPSGMSVGVDYWNGFKASIFLNRDSVLMHEAGIKIVKLVFTPSALSNLASLVPAIINAKFEVLGTLCNLDLLRTNNINGWGNWVYNTVSAYKNYVKVWEVWSEPDWDTGFGSPGDPVKYTSWLKAAYTRAKQADPTCKIIGVSISAVFSTTLSFLTAVYNNGGQPYMDAVSVHPYCANLSPLPPAQTSGNGKAFWKTQDARNIMVQKGDASKPMWITEMGWNSAGAGTTGSTVTEAVQAKYLTDALNYARTNWNWLEAFIVYQWQDGGSIDGGRSYFGLLREDGTPKPSFNAVKAFNSNSSSSSSSNWWNTSWPYRRTITINHQKVSADQTNFPIVIDLTDIGLRGKAQTNGNDFVFADANKVKLSHEIERYDSGTGHLVAWVKVPALSSTADTVIYMYYGNLNCPSQQSKTAVWNTNYLMILHLNESKNVHYDSTSNFNNAVPSSPLNQGTAGKMGGGDDFTGGYVQAPRVFTSQTRFTFSAWVYPRSGARYFISEWWNDQGAFLQVSTNREVQFYINSFKVSKPITLNQWHYVVGTYDGRTARLWVDGGSPASGSVSVPTWPSQNLYVGDRSDHLRKFNGLIDEVRVSNVARSSNWVNTEFNNQKDPSTFYTIGTEERL